MKDESNRILICGATFGSLINYEISLPPAVFKERIQYLTSDQILH